jgi:hypothetical protein
MSDRVPILPVAGSLAPWVGVDLHVGRVTAASDLLRGFFAILTASTSGAVVVEIRDASGVLHEFTIPQGDRTIQEDLPVAAPMTSATDLYIRITDAGTGASDLSGWYEAEASSPPPPGATVSLCTLAEVKDYAGEEGTDNDDLLLWIIDGVTAGIQTKLGRAIVAQTITGEKQSGRGRYALTLEAYPVDDTSVGVILDGTALAAADIEVDEVRGQLYYTPGGGDPVEWPEGFRNVEIGYISGSLVVPADLVLAATIQCAYSYKRTAAKGFRLGERSTVLGGETNTYLVDAWAPEALELLVRHQAPRRFV